MTTATLTLEERVAALEQAVAELRRRPTRGPNDWVYDVMGKVTDLEAFDEMCRLGREYRLAQRGPEPEGDFA